MNLEELAKQTSYTSNMQRYYLACIDEFGEEFKAFIEALCEEAVNKFADDNSV